MAIAELSPYHRIVSTATSPSGSTAIEAYVLVETGDGEGFLPSPFDYSVVTLDGNLEITGSSTISCEPPHVVGDPSTYQGSVWVNGDIELGWSTNIWGDATVTGTINRPENVKGDVSEGADVPERPVWLDEQVQDYIDNTQFDDPFIPNVIDNGTGQVHGAPHTLSCGTHTLTVTSPGTILVSVADAGVVTVQSSTATVTGSPVNLTAGDHLVTVQNSGTIVVVIGGAQYTGNVTMGWGTHGPYPARYVEGDLTISGTSGDGVYRFTGPVCVGGNLNIQSGVNHVVFQGPVKVGGYVYLQGNGTAVFEDTLRVGNYLRVGGSRSVKFLGKVNVDGNLRQAIA